MKKQLLKIAVLASVAIGFVGCGTTSTYTNGIYIPNRDMQSYDMFIPTFAIATAHLIPSGGVLWN